jgi:putative membrane protein
VYRRIAWLLGSAPMLAFGTDGSVDDSFFKDAAAGGSAEVDAGKLAQDKANSRAVKDFGAQKELQMMSRDSFDKSYITDQIKAHEDTMDLFKKEIDTGKDQQAKDFASATVPTVQTHLAEIKQIAASAGISTN